MKFLLIFSFIYFSVISTSLSSTNSESELLYRQESIKNLTNKKVQAEPEIYLSNESILRDSHGEDGLYTDRFYTKKDSWKMSIGYQVSGDFEELSKLRVIDVQIHKKISSYKDQWIGLQLKSLIGEYSALADELTASTDPNSDGFTKRGSNEQAMTIIGLGYGYRFKALTDLFNSDSVFENLMAFGNYITHSDALNSKSYTGFGMTAEYAIQKRISQSLFFNLKLGYNLATVVREQESDEKKADRSLVFKWSTIGIDVGYYF